MPVNARGGVTRRAHNHNPIFFGGTFVSLLVGPHNRRFSAHEDVLCARSTFFKERFQAARKDVSGECLVCFDDLSATETEYCRTCGQNFHASCMQDWLKAKNTCPTCRTFWRRSKLPKTSTLDHLDPEGFEVYVQYLYSDRIPQYNGAADDRIVRLLKAHIVGSTIEDTAFLYAVRRKIVEVAIAARAQTRITYAVIDYTYEHTHEPCTLRSFIVDLYALTGSRESLKDAGNVSRLFLIDMAQSFMEKSAPDGEPDVWGMMAAEGYIELEDDEDKL